MRRFAYVEFLEEEAVQNAILLNESELHGRPLKVRSATHSDLSLAPAALEADRKRAHGSDELRMAAS